MGQANSWEQYEAFTKRELSAFDVVYLFADAVRGRTVAAPGRG